MANKAITADEVVPGDHVGILNFQGQERRALVRWLTADGSGCRVTVIAPPGAPFPSYARIVAWSEMFQLSAGVFGFCTSVR